MVFVRPFQLETFCDAIILGQGSAPGLKPPQAPAEATCILLPYYQEKHHLHHKDQHQAR